MLVLSSYSDPSMILGLVEVLDYNIIKMALNLNYFISIHNFTPKNFLYFAIIESQLLPHAAV